jgi:hypothetical protein
MKDREFPIPSDTLFREFNSYYKHNAIVISGLYNFFIYSEGYKEAAVKLFACLDGSAWNANTLVYPLVFICRQFIELRLKELIICIRIIQDKSPEFPRGHNLKQLWETYEVLLKEVHTFQKDEKTTLQDLKRLILEFHALDPKSDGFRYPVNSDKVPSPSISNLDLGNFYSTMEKIINCFDWLTDWLYHLKDLATDYYLEMKREYENELRNEYESYMRSQY